MLEINDAEDSEVFLASKFGQQYQCSFADGQQEASLDEKTKERIANKGWWMYELCYGEYIRQYHLEDGVINNPNYLGFYESDFDWSSMTEEKAKAKPSKSRFHSQEYVNGSTCDLTGKPRRAQVRYYCDPDNIDYLSDVDELETCAYTLVVYTNKICHHPYLKPPRRTKSVPITCHPLLTEDEYREYEEIKEEEKMRKEALMKEMIIKSESQNDVSDDPDEASTPASPTNTDNEEESWQGYTTETAVDVLQKLITQSLTDELENRYDDYPEKTFEGVDGLASLNEHLDDIEHYKEELQKEMNSRFTEILRETEAELNAAGFKEQVYKDSALKAMSETLEKLLKRVEGREGHKNNIRAMIDEATTVARETLKSESSPDKDPDLEPDAPEHEPAGDMNGRDDMKEEGGDDDNDVVDEEHITEERHGTQEPAAEDAKSSTEDIVEDDEDATSLEYEIKYGDDSQVDIKSDQQTSNTITDQLDNIPPSSDSLGQQAEPVENRKEFNSADPEDSETVEVDESDKAEPRSVHYSNVDQTEDGEDRVVYDDGTVKIRMKSYQYDENEQMEVNMEGESSAVKGQSEERSEEEGEEEHTKILAKDRTAVLRNAEKRVQEAVERKLSKSGLKTSGEGSNNDEIVEAKKQDKLNTNYGFVWKKEKGKKWTSKSYLH
ncbi:hypothetical protein LSH36_429g01018 [Paralvinella palmiformis]|uniref:MRH domain-containing protein n=1 Tax=Paralvinella palmiformis TaxID=53620 RepID=A0AAD9JBU6_9ANNE|nr:hypothetical protein LSH36_429g01018 [Paralvinella palmiformis]